MVKIMFDQEDRVCPKMGTAIYGMLLAQRFYLEFLSRLAKSIGQTFLLDYVTRRSEKIGISKKKKKRFRDPAEKNIHYGLINTGEYVK